MPRKSGSKLIRRIKVKHSTKKVKKHNKVVRKGRF